MKRLIPGTTIPFNDNIRNEAFSAVAPVLQATGGLTLSQLSKLTGLEGSTIQNWIKRGWVSSTVGKKYSEKQILRILLINMLRNTMKLENIVNLMTYINGDVEDTSDDIIDDIQLYNGLCRIIFTAQEGSVFEPEAIRLLVEKEITDHSEHIHTDEYKLHKAMYVMVMAHRSAYLKSEMEIMLADINSEK